MMNQEVVRDHIDGLLREADARRAEREEAAHRSLAGPGSTTIGSVRLARVRLGRLLVVVGSAIAGATDEAHGATEHASRAV
jgi:hypothetical protein